MEQKSQEQTELQANRKAIDRGAYQAFELLLILSIVGLIFAAVIYLFSSARTDVGATIFRANGATIETGVRGLVNHTRRYGNSSFLDSLRIKNKLPEQWFSCSGSTCEYFTDWGSLEIDGDGNTWTLEIDNVPADACIALVTEGLFERTESISINGATFDGEIVEQGDAGPSCDNETNTLIWRQR